MVIPCVAVFEPQLLETVYVTISDPAVTPVTTPEVEMVALELPTVQVPPDADSTSVVIESIHTVAEPLMAPADGAAFIVTG